MLSSDTLYWVGWSACRSVGARTIHRIRRGMNLDDAWTASSHDLRALGIPRLQAERIVHERANVSLEQLAMLLEKHEIRVIRIDESDFPALLKQIYDPPAILYYKGRAPTRHGLRVAVVGTRKTSPYGRRVAPGIVAPLARAGITIVSGLALGIDTIAHQETLTAGGHTIAVLAGGLDRTYPISNTRLAGDIIEHGGAILSEYAPKTPPLRQHFPIRNRIISGLSQMVLVIEGTEDSGSLITARSALDQNRDVCAVPGPITAETSAGPHALLKMGAQLITSADDILQVLQLDNMPEKVQNRKILADTPTEEIVLSILSADPTDVDEIFQKSRLPTSIVNMTLTTLEMKGLIRRSGGTQYIRV